MTFVYDGMRCYIILPELNVMWMLLSIFYFFNWRKTIELLFEWSLNLLNLINWLQNVFCFYALAIVFDNFASSYSAWMKVFGTNFYQLPVYLVLLFNEQNFQVFATLRNVWIKLHFWRGILLRINFVNIEPVCWKILENYKFRISSEKIWEKNGMVHNKKLLKSIKEKNWKKFLILVRGYLKEKICQLPSMKGSLEVMLYIPASVWYLWL